MLLPRQSSLPIKFQENFDCIPTDTLENHLSHPPPFYLKGKAIPNLLYLRQHPWRAAMFVMLLILLAVVGKWTWSVQSRLSKPQSGHQAFPFFAKEKERCPVVYAHRANTGRYPENSLESFLDAAKAGSDVLETDLRLTQDGVLIPFH
ncbi:MAG: glycerophosphodiester phosphodiesterase family protein, partial [Myxococcota bacterium]|nr:glycerophosphodiester phosphodiesterase family protein [Myxococcota bacterium]